MSINTQEELCEHLSSISQTQNFILKEIKNLKEKVEEPYKIIDNLIININKLKQTNLLQFLSQELHKQFPDTPSVQKQ